MTYARSSLDNSMVLRMESTEYQKDDGSCYSSILHPDNGVYRAKHGFYIETSKLGYSADNPNLENNMGSDLREKRRSLRLMHKHCTQDEDVIEECVENGGHIDDRGSLSLSPLPYPVARNGEHKLSTTHGSIDPNRRSPLPYPISIVSPCISPSNSTVCFQHPNSSTETLPNTLQVPANYFGWTKCVL